MIIMKYGKRKNIKKIKNFSKKGLSNIKTHRYIIQVKQITSKHSDYRADRKRTVLEAM